MSLYAQVPLYFSEYLPKNRPFTKLEAAFQYDMDTRLLSINRSKLEYSKTWGWDWGKVDRFINEISKKDDENGLSISIKTSPENHLKKSLSDTDIKQHKNRGLQEQNRNNTRFNKENTNTLFIEEKEREEFKALFDLWNEVVEGTPLPAARIFSKDRQKKCNARIKERSLQEWKEVFRLMTVTPFVCGQSERGWKADFDWIIANDGNAGKVLEGKYKNAGGRPVTSDSRYAMFAGV